MDIPIQHQGHFQCHHHAWDYPTHPGLHQKADDHGQPLEDIKFKLTINKDQAEEIMSYNQLMDYIQKGTDAEEDPGSFFKFRDIVAHQGPLELTDPNH